jgi:hypothetical protein
VLFVGIACLIVAVAWLPFTRHHEPPKEPWWVVPPWQRWCFYGWGAWVFVSLWAAYGTYALVLALRSN